MGRDGKIFLFSTLKKNIKHVELFNEQKNNREDNGAQQFQENFSLKGVEAQ
jgi:hypothetical protein